MDSRQLRYFIAVYEQRNLSRAADQVNVAQSALSHHISNLEAEFATPLFERKSRGMEPTAAGERLYEHARIILRAMAEAETEVREGARVIAGEISIGMANSGVKAIGVALMRTVLTKYPKLKLSLTESLSGATLMHLMVSNVDLALVYNPPSEKELITEAVLEEEMFLVGIPKLVGKGKAPIRFEELNRLPLILLRYGLGLSSRAAGRSGPAQAAGRRRHPARQFDHRHDRRAGGRARLHHRDKAVRARGARGRPADRTQGDRAEADPHALPLPPAQPPNDLRHGRDAPPDARIDRRAGAQRRLAGGAGGVRHDQYIRRHGRA